MASLWLESYVYHLNLFVAVTSSSHWGWISAFRGGEGYRKGDYLAFPLRPGAQPAGSPDSVYSKDLAYVFRQPARQYIENPGEAQRYTTISNHCLPKSSSGGELGFSCVAHPGEAGAPSGCGGRPGFKTTADCRRETVHL